MHQVSMIIHILLFFTRALGAHNSPNNDMPDVLVCGGDDRSVWSIVWSSLATIFACTWLAVHPNVPHRSITRKGAIYCAIEQMKIMAITILAPEVIVGWAAEQFIVAWKLSHRKYNSVASVIHPATEQEEKSKLTLAHGFLLSMGGFYYTCKHEIPHQELETDEATSTMRPSSLPSSAHDSQSGGAALSNPTFLSDSISARETLDMPGVLVTLEALESEPSLVQNLAAISPETIEDKSKGDALSKMISILQLSWFIIQCAARAFLHLPITLLEMTALAFAGLSIITYSLWWYKPLNVKYQVSLDGSDCAPWPETNDPQESTSSISPSWTKWAGNACSFVTSWIVHTTLGIPVIDNHDVDIGYAAIRFYSGTTEEYRKRFLTMVGVGSLFGAFHCLAWSFYFPSHTQMMLWRFSSTAVLIGLLAGGGSAWT
ncbi:hypothetical protein IW261DRAFT_1405972, partial [Armillaria novae-zelandiae]